MLYVRKVYQNPPPCSRLSQRFLAYFRDSAGNSVELVTPGVWGLSGW